MTWEETIRFIRTREEFRWLVEQSYLDENLLLNAERFRSSMEFEETLRLLNKYAPAAKFVLDVGAGNGISSIALALNGYKVTAVEPDGSLTVGCGAIEILEKEYKTGNLDVINSFGEKLPFEDGHFDVVYMRQAMHHAADLYAFVKEASRVLKNGGVLITIRDHVVYNQKDKQLFLAAHPLQQFYGGENAFSAQEYSSAMTKSGLKIKKMFAYHDSAINYFPASKVDIENAGEMMKERFRASLEKRFGSWVINSPFLQFFELVSLVKNGAWRGERRIPGRMYSFIAVKSTL